MHGPAQIGSHRSNPSCASLVDASTTELIYELLDAHEDTRQLVAEQGEASEQWRAHLGYLRDLQRVGRETLPSLAAPPSDSVRLRTSERPGLGVPDGHELAASVCGQARHPMPSSRSRPQLIERNRLADKRH